MVSEPRHETTQGRPAKAIRIPGVLCDDPGVKTKILSTKNKRPGCKYRSSSHGESAEVFLLDILSHRMSVIRMLQQRPWFSRIRLRANARSHHERCAQRRQLEF